MSRVARPIGPPGVGGGCALTPDQIVTTCGAQEGLSLCLRAICEPGDTVAVESPIYFGVWQAMCSQRLRAVEVPTHPRDGMCLDALRAAMDQQRIKAVIAIPTFSNPLGHCMPDRKRKALMELLTERDIPLIEDDIYGDLAFTPDDRTGADRPRACKAFDAAGLVLYVSSFTKTLAPGYRVGWVAPGRYQARVEHLKFAGSIATATLPQLTIAEFLANGGYDRYLRKIRRTFARNVALTRLAVENYFPAGTRVTRPAGGFVLWVELPESVDSVELHALALRQNISIAPGPMFSAQAKYRNFVRLNGGQWSDRIEAAVREVGRLAHELCG